MKLISFFQQLMLLSFLTLLTVNASPNFSDLTFQVVSYDCNSGVLQYQFTSSDNTPISVSLPGIFGGTMNPNTVATYTFPSDGRTGRTITGTASQSGIQISVSYTNGCGNTPPPSNPPTNPPSSGNLAFQIVSYDCNSGVLQYQFTGGDGSSINVSLPGIYGGNTTANTVLSYTFPSDGRQGRTVTGTATQGGNSININFTNGCNINPNPPSNPPTNPSAGGSGNGLSGSYFNNGNLSGSPVLTRTDGTINFNWGNGSPDPSLNNDYFSVRWTGQVEAPVTGTYTFRTNNDDATRLWVNNQLLIDDWNGHAPTVKENTIYLNQGQKYDIKMEYAEFTGGAQALLYWVLPGQNQEIIPQSRLYASATGSTRPSGAQVGRILFPGDPNLNINWDWSQPQYKIWYKSGGIKSEYVANPFNSNVPSVVVKGDQYKEDGWMLVARDFGISPEEASAIGANPDALVLPFFALYNKYTGKFRVFIYNPSERNEFTHHSVSLGLAGNNGLTAPAMLTFGNSDSTQLYDNHYNPSLTQNVLTPATPSGWSVADFDLSFFDQRIEYTNQYDDWSLIISIDDITISKSVSTGNIALDGTVQPQSNGFFRDATKSVNEFRINGLPKAKELVSSLTKGFEKAAEVAATASSALELIVSATDLFDGLTGNSAQGYDVKLNGTLNLSGITTSSVGGYTYAVPIKPRSSRPLENNYYPLQTIPWGIVALRQHAPLDVKGLSWGYSHPSCISTESGHLEAIDCADFHANGYGLYPIIPNLEVRNGLKLISVQAAYFKPDRTDEYPGEAYGVSQHAFPFEYGRYKNGNYIGVPNSSDFESKEFIVKGTAHPFNKVGVLFTFQPTSPTIKITGPVTIYRVFSLETNVQYVNSSSLQANARSGEEDQAFKKPYPNPFDRLINIPLTSLKIGSRYKVQILSLDGKLVWENIGIISSDTKAVEWNGQSSNHTHLNPGMYISKIIENDVELGVHKITLLK